MVRGNEGEGEQRRSRNIWETNGCDNQFHIKPKETPPGRGVTRNAKNSIVSL